jgi:hypothetical protein
MASASVKSKKVFLVDMMTFIVALAAVIVVWGVVVAFNVFWALPSNPQNSLNTSSEVSSNFNKTNEADRGSQEGISPASQLDNATCHRSLRRHLLTNTCYVPCQNWEWRTDLEKKLKSIANYTTIVISIVCVILTIVTWIKLSKLWSFPLITPLYVLLAFAALVMSRSIPYIFGKGLYCSDKDFLASVKNPTPFCVATGAIRHYLLFCGSFWLMFTFGNLWWVVVFPTSGNRLFIDRRRFHAIQSIVAWGASMIPVVVVFAFNGRYSQRLTFPYVCYPSTMNLFYYVYLLPVQFFMAICSTSLISTCYSLVKQGKRRLLLTSHQLSNCNREEPVGNLYPIERRLVFLLVTFFVIVNLAVVGNVFEVRNHHLIENAFKQYRYCAIATPAADCIQIFRKHTMSSLFLVVDFSGLNQDLILPTVFYFGYKEVRKFWFSVITCGIYSRRRNVSKDSTFHMENKTLDASVTGFRNSDSHLQLNY